jgi:hypothetical protein
MDPTADKLEFRAGRFPSTAEALMTIRKLSDERWEFLGLIETVSYKAIMNVGNTINSVPVGGNTGAFRRRLK